MRSPAESVNPMIGTVGHLLTATRPLVMRPHSPVRLYALPEPDMRDYYFADKTRGFQLGACEIMCAQSPEGEYLAPVDHSLEDAHPYYYCLRCADTALLLEATTTMHCAAYRFSKADFVRIKLTQDAEVRVSDEYIDITATEASGVRQYIRLFAEGLQVYEQSNDALILRITTEICQAFAAVSYISHEKAGALYTKEIYSRPFDSIADESHAQWEKTLGRIRVSGGTSDMRSVFYTALYRSFMRMCDYAEIGEYMGLDGQVHEGEHFYCDDGIWDTFRCMHPLQLLLEPGRQRDIMQSYLLMYEQTGSLPCFPTMGGDRPVMLGFHTIASLADAVVKGLDIDADKALEAALESTEQQSMLPWVCRQAPTQLDSCYYEKGFFPALKKGEAESEGLVHEFEARQAVAVTLEHAYDDWCTAVLADKAGRTDIRDRYLARAENYKTLYNPDTGFMSPRSADGEWVEDFDPMFGGGQGGRDYFAECNSYTYTWSVFHDPHGLAELMGGADAMGQRLDELFTTAYRGKYKFYFQSQFPDETGLMGQFPMGNEPAFHIPYMYAYCGQPYKTQSHIREIIDLWFTNSPYGICGDEDGGAMSSWLVFSAMGFYPLCPGSNKYILGTPVFDSISIALENGREFRISARGAGKGLRYIQSATLNSKSIDRAYITHEEILAGGKLTLKMGKYPNKSFGTTDLP